MEKYTKHALQTNLGAERSELEDRICRKENECESLGTEWNEHCRRWDEPVRPIAPHPIDHLMRKAKNRRLCGVLCFSIGVLAFAMFSTLSMGSSFSPSVVFVVAGALAALLAGVATTVTSILTRADSMRPETLNGTDRVLVLGILLFGISMTLLMYARFGSPEFQSFVSAIVVLFESSVLFAGAGAEAGFGILKWNIEIPEKIASAERELTELKSRLGNCEAYQNHISKGEKNEEESGDLAGYRAGGDIPPVRPNGSAKPTSGVPER